MFGAAKPTPPAVEYGGAVGQDSDLTRGGGGADFGVEIAALAGVLEIGAGVQVTEIAAPFVRIEKELAPEVGDLIGEIDLSQVELARATEGALKFIGEIEL
jgi:hypothetical protein